MTQRTNSKIVDYTQTKPALPIYFEDEYLIVVDKPADLLSQPDHTGAPAVSEIVKSHAQKSHLLHRLDRPVSGLMVLAKRADAARHLAKQFKEHRVRKSYWALCHGQCPQNGVLQHWIKKTTNPVKALVFDDPHPDSKKAVLSFRLLNTQTLDQGVYSLLEVHLQTGRPHQIRAQFAHIGHPIVGDVKYGSDHHSLPLHLRSVMLEFEHPAHGHLFSIESYPESTLNWIIEK
jgi:23S rRNA pseudouridine1911/1915/1917 synthase